MEQFRVRRTSSDYIGAPNKEQKIGVKFDSTFKNLTRENRVKNVDLYKLFLNERDNCRNYRLMLTINPYCTNVLFNQRTEVTYVNDGEIERIDYDNDGSCEGAIGKTNNLTPYDMVRNTEYSSEKYGFSYYPGLDIFNNHLLRNTSYRIVNKLNSENEEDKHKFNTIEDYFRLDNGEKVKKCCRLDINDTNTQDKHLYNRDDILSFHNGDAIKENLKEQDGWFGFYNNSTLDVKDGGVYLDINRVINNKGNCQFIDMYPGRELYSFSPIYNKINNKIEYNWDVVLTYPYESVVKDTNGKDFLVINSGEQNGLLVVDCKMITSNGGKNVLLFRTLTKHNLQKGDSVHLYFDEEEGNNWHLINRQFNVSSIGDEYGKNKDYYFTINDNTILTHVFCKSRDDNYTSWDYIRDYFYKSFDISDIDDIQEINESKFYNNDELVKYKGELYICIDKFEYNSENDDIEYINSIISCNFNKLDNIINTYIYGVDRGIYGKWEEINENYFENVIPVNWSNNYEYDINDVVLYNDVYYKCIKNNTLGAWNNNNFQEIKEFNEETVYFLDDIILQGESVYKCIGNIHKEGGLMDFPGAQDCYIKVNEWDEINKQYNTVYYTLFNYDIQESFIDASNYTNSNLFIQGIVNNAFRTEDGIDRTEEGFDYDDNGLVDVDLDGDGLIDDINNDGVSDFNVLWSDYISFRVVKIVNDVEVKYYVRKFAKLDDYSNERYKLAFSNTIYGDENSQITYTDTINTDGIVDNLGRELTEIYLTIIKTNNGFRKWYGLLPTNDNETYNIESSRCFGPVTCGFDFHTTSIDNNHIIEKRKSCLDVKTLKNDLTNYYNNYEQQFLLSLTDKEITHSDEFFYGDIVEFNPVEYKETVLSDVNFRFNTVQRELHEQYNESNEFILKYDELVRDDYEGGFTIKTEVNYACYKDEGYYYKPHYKLQLRGFSELKQDNHKSLFIKNAKPYQNNGMFIQIETKVKHSLLQGDKLLLIDKITGLEWFLDVVCIKNSYSFIINIIRKNSDNYVDWITTCMNINNGTFTLKKINESIPKYAVNLGDNLYVWRDTVGLWDSETPKELVYCNNSLYLDECINFYLKRQNNDGSLNSYFGIKEDNVFNDYEGLKENKPSKYDYIKESEYIC